VQARRSFRHYRSSIRLLVNILQIRKHGVPTPPRILCLHRPLAARSGRPVHRNVAGMEGAKLDDQLYVEWHGPYRRLGTRYIPSNYVVHVDLRSFAEEPCHDRFGNP